MPDQFDDSVMDASRLAMGNQVGDLAMGYFGDFAEVPYSDNKSEMICETERILKSGASVICEAAFSYNGNLCIVDILRVFDDYVEIVEVKSSSGDDDEKESDLKEIHLHDMSYQYYVLNGCGLNVKSVSLMELNRKYIRQGDLDIQQLFTLTDCTDTVLKMQSDIPDKLAEIKRITTMENEPELIIGSRCGKPYECGYKGWCWRHLPKNNIFQIGWRMWGSKKDKAYQHGVISFADVINSNLKLNDKQLRQVETALYDLPPHIDKPAIKSFLGGLSYPIYHFDFETYQQPIPLWDGVRPYMMIPFQYSLHIEYEDGTVVHKEFLGKEGADPRRELAERVCEDIPVDACTLAWHKPFEVTQLKHLAELFPDLAEHLLSIAENMQDLLDPFKNGHYYCKAMGGNARLKTVLPALFPDDPELSYDNLEHIHHGGDVMALYPALHEKPPEEIVKIRQALLAYCKLDTLAMVKILGKLRGVA